MLQYMGIFKHYYACPWRSILLGYILVSALANGPQIGCCVFDTLVLKYLFGVFSHGIRIDMSMAWKAQGRFLHASAWWGLVGVLLLNSGLHLEVKGISPLNLKSLWCLTTCFRVSHAYFAACCCAIGWQQVILFRHAGSALRVWSRKWSNICMAVPSLKSPASPCAYRFF